MSVYLPIAEMPVNALLIIALGLGVGLLSGLFGVGGGFLMTPILLLVGIPPAVAVGTESGQIFAASLSATLSRLKRNSVDFRMGLLFVAGGMVGVGGGVFLLRLLLAVGNFQLILYVCYMVLLTSVGGLMLAESLRTVFQTPKRTPRHRHFFFHGLPGKLRFPRSGLYESALPPLVLGTAGGLMSSVLGTSGGFLLVPAMIYLLGMPTMVAVGTSLFQTAGTSAVTLFLQAEINHSVDLVLMVLLIGGGTVGAQLGSRIGLRLSPGLTRFLMATLVLSVAAVLCIRQFLPPDMPFVVSSGW